MKRDSLRGVVSGSGYFSQFHLDAWRRIEGVEIAALCSLDAPGASAAAANHGIAHVYGDVEAMLDEIRPDFIDIVTPPQSHAAITRAAISRGVAILCQKPLAPTYSEAEAMVAEAEEAGVPFMVHDNFRFQPWHREIRRLLDSGSLGTLESICGRTRMGDGFGAQAYLSRQPYFRDMKRFLIFETGVHFIDVYRYLGGEIASVFARTRRLNPGIEGEDAATLLFDFAGGAQGLWDGDRTHVPDAADPRLTFGQFWIETGEATLRLSGDGRMTLQRRGGQPVAHRYEIPRGGFAGDSVHATFDHFIARLRDGGGFETDGRDYLRTLLVQEAAYRSAETGRSVSLA
jgi:predicted dehydrogenase